VALVGTIVCPTPGAAQVKAPIFGPDQTKAASLKEATAAGDFKHGNRLVITKKDNTQIVGTLVRVDRQGKRLFLRTQPGEPPVAVPDDEVKKAEVVMKPAAPEGAAAERPENRPEIHRMDIRQGTDSRVRFFAPTLSPAEKATLDQIEAAETEMAPYQDPAGLMAQYLRNEQALDRVRQQAQEAYYRAQTGLYTVAANGGFNYYGGLGWGYAGYYGAGYYGGYGGSFGLPFISPPDMGNEGVFKAALAANLAKGPNPEALAKARENLARAQRNAVYEDGHLVAVLTDEPKK
jgi:hypothetical protein